VSARPVQDLACAATTAESDSDSDAEGAWAGASIPSVESSAIRQEMSQCVRDFVERLPDNYKSVIVLSELEGFKNSEIGEILGISLDTVKIPSEARPASPAEARNRMLKGVCHVPRLLVGIDVRHPLDLPVSLLCLHGGDDLHVVSPRRRLLHADAPRAGRAADRGARDAAPDPRSKAGRRRDHATGV